MTMIVCLGGVENFTTFAIYENDGEYIAQVDNQIKIQTETFSEISPAKKWVNRKLNDSCSEQNEIDRFS